MKRFFGKCFSDRYPINMVMEIRVTGLDQPADVGVEHAEAPVFSAVGPDSTIRNGTSRCG